MGVQVKCPSCHRGVLLYVGMGEYHCNDAICMHGVDDISYHALELDAYAATVAAKDARIAELEKALAAACSSCGCLHHAKRDQHGIMDPCPVSARIDAALTPRAESEVRDGE